MPSKIPRSDLLAEIQRLANELNKSPTIQEMKNFGKYSERPYISCFGSWNLALEAADLSPNLQQNITRDDLLDELHRLAANTDSTPRIVDMNDIGRYSHQVYLDKFGGWNDALRTAGFEPNQPRKADRAHLITEIRRLADDLGRTPRIQDMNQQGGYSDRPYRREFGSWTNAVRAAELVPNPPGNPEHFQNHGPYPTKEEIKKSLSELSTELGRTPTREEAVGNTEYSRRDFERSFGSYTDACKSVGLTPNRHIDLNSEALIDEIHRLKEELDRTPRVTDLKEQGKYSQQPYLNEFGGWSNALREAGLEPNQRKEPSKEELVSKLRILAEEINRTPTRRDVAARTPFSRKHYETAFGSYKEACQVADLEPNNQEVSRKALINELQRLEEERGRTPRQQDVRNFGDHASSTYRAEFGSWNSALKAAGMKPNQRKDITRDELLEELERLQSELGRVPTQSDIRDQSRFSIRPFNTQFGGISLAVEAAGMDPSWNNLSQEMLISELKRIGDELGRPPYTNDMVDHGRWGIMPYYRVFASWGEALETAGFELPERPHFTTGAYGAGWNRTTKERVRKRDGQRCMDCGMNQSDHVEQYGKKLHVHHITPAYALEEPKIRNSEQNLITLCIPCHVKWDQVRGNERVPNDIELPDYISPPDPPI